MSEISEMMEKVNINNIVSYFMYGQDSVVPKVENYEKRIEDAYDKIFDRLEKIEPNLNREDDELFKTVLEFAITHNDVYLQMGILIGVQIYKTFDEEYKKFASDNIYSKIKGQVKDCLEKEICE